MTDISPTPIPVPTILAKTRQCLRCNKDFDSKGPSNRICPKCNSISAKNRSRNYEPGSPRMLIVPAPHKHLGE